MVVQIYPTINVLLNTVLMVWPNDWIRLVWPRYMIKTFKIWFKMAMLNAFQRTNLIAMTVQCGISHTTLCSNLVRWDQFLIVQQDTGEWVWMVNVCKARTWQITLSMCCSDFDNLSTPPWPMLRVCTYKYESPMQTATHCVFCGMTRVTWPSFEWPRISSEAFGARVAVGLLCVIQ